MATDGSGAGLLHHFKGSQGDGGHPQGALLETRDEYLYGTTSTGGNFGLGTLFRIRKDDKDYRVLHHFAGVNRDVGIPMTCLVDDGFGTLFGVGRSGGGTSQGGGVFRIQTDGTGYRQLHGFGAAAGGPRLPGNGLALTPGGWLLGVTMSGGQRQVGTVFVLDKEGSMLHVLHHFSGTGGQDGAHPVAPLVRAGECFYGSTEKGGAYNAGTIFKLSLP